MMLTMTHEPMSGHFAKWHLGRGETGNPLVLHRFAAPDNGPHHDHQFDCRSYILHGGYSEEVLHPDGSMELRHHSPGDVVEIPHDHTHRIIDLHEGEAITLDEVLGPKVQESGFFEWRNGQMWQRRWNESEFVPVRGT
ncbi:hypothetical protein [Paracoccus sp. S3-43]|uniref:hypothetical protein n=1 Tax=Paracoccus sp. S3-43 TaxID=3030011 RepID=UPI0023B0F9AC|nr:hypothetical protein [Paracoccus sp. S3-43]WEF24094.1 hypothetical protein PXD02_15110 [Paracoccus sp. S3-43]